MPYCPGDEDVCPTGCIWCGRNQTEEDYEKARQAFGFSKKIEKQPDINSCEFLRET